MSETTETIDEIQRPQCAVLFELENLAFGARQSVYDRVSKAVTGKKIPFSPIIFSRFCYNKGASDYVEPLAKFLGKSESATETLGKNLEAAVTSVANDLVDVDASVKRVVVEAKARGHKIAALCHSDIDVAVALLKKVDADLTEDDLFCYAPNALIEPSVDSWLKVTKLIGVPATRCVSFVTSGAAGKSAVSAGMKCVIRPDEFTSFEDMGGADLVVDKLSKDVVDLALGLLDK